MIRGSDWLHWTRHPSSAQYITVHRVIPAHSLAFAYIVQVSFKYLSPLSSPVLFKLTNNRSDPYPSGISRHPTFLIFFFFFYFYLLFLHAYYFFLTLYILSNHPLIIVQHYQSSWLRKSIPSKNQNNNFSSHTRVSPRGGIAVLHEDKGKCKGSTDLFPIVSPRWAESRVNVLWDAHVLLVLPKGVKLTLGTFGPISETEVFWMHGVHYYIDRTQCFLYILLGFRKNESLNGILIHSVLGKFLNQPQVYCIRSIRSIRSTFYGTLRTE